MAGWTVVALTLLAFFPFKRAEVPCARLVGTPETRPACQLVLDAANEQAFLFQTLPMLVAIAAGYLVVVVIEVRRYRGLADLSA